MAQTARREAAGMDETLARSADVMRRFVVLPSQAASQMLTGEDGLARCWLRLAEEQLTHNLETFRRLTEARDWREALEIQGEFYRDSLARATDGAQRCLAAAGETVTRLLAVAEEGVKGPS